MFNRLLLLAVAGLFFCPLHAQIDPSQKNTEALQIVANGYHLLTLQRYQEAIDYFDSAIAIAPNQMSYLWYRGQALALNNQHREAIADYTKAIFIAEQEIELARNIENIDLQNPLQRQTYHNTCLLPFIYYARSTAYHCAKNSKAALNDMKRAAELGCREAQAALWAKGILW